MPIDIGQYTADVLRHFANQDHAEGKGHPLRTANSGEREKPGWIEHRREMGWHIRGHYPAELYAKKRPSEDDAWYKWRKDNFRAITKGPIRDEIKNVMRIFADSNFNAKIDDDTREYLSEPRFQGETFTDWMFSRAFEEMILDANSCIVPMPYGPGLVDDTVQIDVDLRIIESPQVIDRNPGFISWKSYDKSPYKPNGAIFYVVDDEAYWKIEETNATDNNRWLTTEVYRHGGGRGMHVVLGGIAESRRGYIMFKSWFEGYLPFANETLDQFSTFQVSFSQNGFPIRTQPSSKCTYSNGYSHCSSGYLDWDTPDGENHHTQCPSCKGSGKEPPVYPGAVFVTEANSVGDDQIDNPISFVSPPVEALKLMSESWKEALEFAKEAISQRFIQQAQSGEAKDRDMDGKHSMIQVIAKWFFGRVMQKTLENIVILRHPFRYERIMPIVVIPTDFKLKDSAVLLEELKELGTINTTTGIYTEKVRQYCEKEFGNDFETKRKNEIQILYDFLAIYSIEEQNAMKASGAITVRDCQVSAMTYHMIEMIVIEKGVAVLEMPFLWWETELDKRIEAALPEPVEVATFAGAFEEDE